jgi:hypothetical protein
MPAPLRIVTTNDLIGSFAPQATSYGRLPGARALVAAVERLRAEGGAVVWIDTGDFAQGSPLGALSDGAGGFLAAARLPFDVSVVGNHELDWGAAHLRRWAAELPFPLLAANAELGFPGTTVLEAGGRRIGVVGLTYPDMPSLHPAVAVAADTVAVTREAAAALRAEGADMVVAALHDGSDRAVGDDGPVADPARPAEFCAGVRGAVDLVLGGHTLIRHVGELEGVPYLQPWPFGSQLGVAEVGGDGEIALRTIDPEPAGPWDGPGGALLARLESEPVASLDRDLVNGLAECSLAEVVAAGAVASVEADVAIVIPTDMWNQAPRDGVHAFLPAGEVTVAQTRRLAPLAGARSAWGGQIAVAELPRAAAMRAIDATAAACESDSIRAYAPVVAGRGTTAPQVRIALAPRLRPLVDAAAGSEVTWHPTAGTWHDALVAGLLGAAGR